MSDFAGTFRIDDVSLNTDSTALTEIVCAIRERLPLVRIMLAVSPLVHGMANAVVADRERAFPRLLSAMSDHRKFFGVNLAGIPYVLDHATFATAVIASHGLVHVDHRLMGREAQELSIVASCSLVGAKIFVPPFNKWNRDTESVCAEHGIKLVKFENGWRHVRFNAFDAAHDKYYLHTHDTTAAWLREWMSASAK